MLLNSLNNKESNRLKKLASLFSVTLSVLLSILKLFASIYTGSLSILSSMVDSITDIIASSITFVAIRYSTKPASRKFRYGYGKAEYLSSFLQSFFIATSGLFIMYDGIKRFFFPQKIEESSFGLIIMFISLILTIALVTFQKYVTKKTNSAAIKGDSLHYMTDILTNISVIIALIIAKFSEIYWIDNIVAIGIATYLFHTSYKLAKEAVTNLMDHELDEEIRNDIKNSITSMDFVRGLHDLRTRSLGGKFMIEFHLELDPDISLIKAHDLSHKVENKILDKFPSAQIIIHQEPKGAKEYHLDTQIAENEVTEG